MKRIRVKPKYPVVHYAIQYTGQNLEELKEWVASFDDLTTIEVDVNSDPDEPNPDLMLTDSTLEKGEYEVFVCDWIIIEFMTPERFTWKVFSDELFHDLWHVV